MEKPQTAGKFKQTTPSNQFVGFLLTYHNDEEQIDLSGKGKEF